MNDLLVPQDKRLIIIKQLPIIEERLREIKTQFETEAREALSLACTEETLQAVKRKRAELTKLFAQMEQNRKEAKQAILAPYETFEKTYRDCITDVYKPADEQLARKIHEVEDSLKAERRVELEEYFYELLASHQLDHPAFESMNLSINLSASTKSLKEQICAFVIVVAKETETIKAMEHSTEIMVEYRSCLNLAQAIATVTARHKAIEQEMAKQEATKATTAIIEEAVKKVEEALPPPVVEEKVYQTTFTVKGTIAQLKELKNFMIEKGIEYEQQ